MKPRVIRQSFARQNAAYAIALRIEFPGVDTASKLSVHEAENTAAHSAFGGKPNLLRPGPYTSVRLSAGLNRAGPASGVYCHQLDREE